MKKENILTVLAIILIIGFSVFNIVSDYNKSNITIEELTLSSETFDSYTSSKSSYKIKCESGNEYIVRKKTLDKNQLDEIIPGSILLINANSKEVVELKVNGEYLVTLDSYQSTYRKMITTDIILGIMLLLLIVGCFVYSNLHQRKLKIEEEKLREKLNTFSQEKYDDTVKSIKKDENGILRCNFDNEEFEIDVSFAKAIIDYIDNDRIIEMFDGDSNTERYLFYKLGNKLYYDYVSIEDTDIDDLEDVLYDELDWSYPFDIEPTDEECQKFKEALEYYISSKQKKNV